MGIVRHCSRYAVTRAASAKGDLPALRCVSYTDGAGSPVCDRRLKGGGRSPGLIRNKVCGKKGSKSTERKR